MLDTIKGFVTANLIILIAVIVILPPVGAVLIGLFFVPLAIAMGFAWLYAGLRRVLTKGKS